MSKNNLALCNKLEAILKAIPGVYQITFTLDQQGNVAFPPSEASTAALEGMWPVRLQLQREGAWLMATEVSIDGMTHATVTKPIKVIAQLSVGKVTSLIVEAAENAAPARNPDASFSCVVSELAKALAKADSTNRLSPFSFLVGGYGAQMIFNNASQEDMNAIRGISDVIYSNLRLKDGDHVNIVVTDNSTFAEHDFDIKMRWIDLPALPRTAEQ